MRDYVFSFHGNAGLPVAKLPSETLTALLGELDGPLWHNNTGQSLDSVRDRIRLELEIRAMGLSVA